jgi:hypothetical protein
MRRLYLRGRSPTMKQFSKRKRAASERLSGGGDKLTPHDPGWWRILPFDQSLAISFTSGD